MCKFMSAILLESGELIIDEHTDSHEDLIRAYHIRDGHVQRGRFVRLEFLPPNDGSKLADLSAWALQVDENETPEWYDAADVRPQLEARVQRMLIADERDILLGGCWVLHGGARVGKIIGARIPILAGGSVQVVRDGGSVQVVYAGGSVQVVYAGGSVQVVRDGGSVQEVRAGGSVQEVRADGSVQEVYDGGSVQEVYAGGSVQEVYAGGMIVHDYRQPITT